VADEATTKGNSMHDKSLLAKSAGVSLGVVAVVGLLSLSTGTGLAVPAAGIGGFTVEADSIEGDDLVLYPDVVERDQGSNAPQAIIELQANRIEGLRLVKTIDLGDVSVDTLDGTVRILVESDGTAETDQIRIQSPGLNASEATFNGLAIQGTDSATRPRRSRSRPHLNRSKGRRWTSSAVRTPASNSPTPRSTRRTS
jgi:hypothetical protein